jgi:hypothetical protein
MVFFTNKLGRSWEEGRGLMIYRNRGGLTIITNANEHEKEVRSRNSEYAVGTSNHCTCGV